MSATKPDGQSIAWADQLSSTSAHVNAYLRKKINEILRKHHAEEEYKSIIEALDETTRITRIRAKLMEDISGKTWAAIATESELENLKANTINYLDASAIEGMEHLKEHLGADKKVSNITMVYYIDANSQLSRGYLINGELIANKEDELVVDKIFHSWLISHDMASDDKGMIYRRLKDGKVTDQLVPWQEVKSLLDEPTTSLQITAKKVDPNLEFTILWAPPDAVSTAQQLIDEKEMSGSAAQQLANEAGSTTPVQAG